MLMSKVSMRAFKNCYGEKIDSPIYNIFDEKLDNSPNNIKRIKPIEKNASPSSTTIVDEKGTVSILNENIIIGKKYSYEYVWSVLNTKAQNLSHFHKATKNGPKELIRIDEYKLRESVRNRIHVNDFVKEQ